MEKTKIAIIGAGLTGLTTAFYLKKKNIPFHLFDTQDRAGGVILTKKNQDFIWETGPNTGVIGKPEVVELFEDLNATAILETASSVAGNRFIWKGDRLHALPSSPISGLKTPLFSWKDKFGMLFEPFRKKGENPEENLTSFVKRRLGSSVLDYAVDPFVSGVYAGNPDTIIPKYALPKLYALEENYGSFIRGSIHKMLSKKTEREKKATKKTFSATNGLSTLIERLVEAVGKENISLNCQGLFILRSDNSYCVHFGIENLNFSQVIFTGNAKRLPEAFPFLKEEHLDDASRVDVAQVMEVSVGFKKWEGIPLNGFGALMPSKEGRNILGALFMSSLFKNRAPQGGALLAVFMGGKRHPEYLDLNDNEIFEMVQKDLKESLNIPTFNPDLFEITRHRLAIPQYDSLSPARFKAFALAEEKFPGLYLGGNGIGGIGIADRIKQGKELAARLAADLTKTKTTL